MPAPEIIDLTSPYATDVEDLTPGIEPHLFRKQESRKRRKRKPKGNPSATNHQSRQNSPGFQIDSTPSRKRKRPEGPSDVSKNCSDTECPNIFFIDLSPATLPSTHQFVNETLSEEKQTIEKLLVPPHVTVLGSTPVEIIAQHLPSEDDDDFIDYLDYEDTRPSHRYYDDFSSDTAIINRTVCKNCGAEGQHKTSACPVQICLTCGVRDEHSTRSCPISKVCFTCGMKGHINARKKNCPNRRSAHALMIGQGNECDRCSSSRHKTNECPTLWRLYKYFTVEERDRIISIRKSKKDFQLGQGGEGYVADDEWCYNCGSYGHWGDDCRDLTPAHSPEEFSAFSNFNITTGPFYDSSKEANFSSTRSRREDRKPSAASNWEKDVPSHVGRQGRMKSRATLEQQARRMEDNTEDWFRTTDKRNEPQPTRRKEPRAIKFGKLSLGASSHTTTTSPPSLMERIGDFHRTDMQRTVESRPDNSTRRSYKHEERRSSDRSGNWPRHVATGPRYRGGYSR
ncbi:hypothetical protein CPB84DRAFT_1840661 [Gymnopilus junonius]|uniref:CCHC-type domain-containing protein n=1 Tax=Gymnopilus junonius TaxID=109634 RepID=A0A9P5TUS2_GYMJU|nr:hypothetical protein CPB84DRAFT_1840661 [Gymnopilus junonius]